MAALRLVVVVEMMSCEWMDLYPCWRSSTYTVLGIYWKMIGVIIQSHLQLFKLFVAFYTLSLVVRVGAGFEKGMGQMVDGCS